MSPVQFPTNWRPMWALSMTLIWRVSYSANWANQWQPRTNVFHSLLLLMKRICPSLLIRSMSGDNDVILPITLHPNCYKHSHYQNNKCLACFDIHNNCSPCWRPAIVIGLLPWCMLNKTFIEVLFNKPE